MSNQKSNTLPYDAREHHQDLIINLKVCIDDMIKEIKNDLEKDNKFNCNLTLKTLELLTNFVIVDAQLNHNEKEYEHTRVKQD